jgi:hypothetical protein
MKFFNTSRGVWCGVVRALSEEPGGGQGAGGDGVPATRNKQRAPRYDVGKTVRREKTLIALERSKS